MEDGTDGLLRGIKTAGVRPPGFSVGCKDVTRIVREFKSWRPKPEALNPKPLQDLDASPLEPEPAHRLHPYTLSANARCMFLVFVFFLPHLFAELA